MNDNEIERVDIETSKECPICSSKDFKNLEVTSSFANSANKRELLSAVLNGNFFERQSLAVCSNCTHLFQLNHPSPTQLQSLYDHAHKIFPTHPHRDHHGSNYFTFLLSNKSPHYTIDLMRRFQFMKELSLLENLNSVIEFRTFGGTLALLREMGVAHIEGAYNQEFDRDFCKAIYGLTQLHEFSYAKPIKEFKSQLQEYDLILGFEFLTHSPDIKSYISWIEDHLAPNGSAVLFVENNVPNYRKYHKLTTSFNNFHMNFLNRHTLGLAIEKHPNLEAFYFPGLHPIFKRSHDEPHYMHVVIRRRGAAEIPELRKRKQVERKIYRADYYESWIRRDNSRLLLWLEMKKYWVERRIKNILELFSAI
jgi:hypothetical protein